MSEHATLTSTAPHHLDPGAGRIRIGIDIGGTKIHAVALGATSTPLAERRIGTGPGHEVPTLLPRLVHEVLESASLDPSSVATIGIGIPGIVTPDGETVGHAVNLGVSTTTMPVTAPLAAAFPHAAIRLMNDVNAAAVGVSRLLYPAVRDLVYLSIGTGLAAGTIVDGRLASGSSGGAGEIGHFPLEPRRFPCRCGQFGCVETIASGGGLAARLPDAGSHVAGRLFAAGALSDELAIARDDFLAGIAATIRLLVLANDPEVIVIGGGVANVGDPLLTAIADRLAVEAASSPLLASRRIPQRLRLIPPFSSVAAVGAADIGEEA